MKNWDVLAITTPPDGALYAADSLIKALSSKNQNKRCLFAEGHDG